MGNSAKTVTPSKFGSRKAHATYLFRPFTALLLSDTGFEHQYSRPISKRSLRQKAPCRRNYSAAGRFSKPWVQYAGMPIEWVRAPSLFIAQKGSNPLWGSLPFLVRERGLEPPRHNHTHLKRACLPFQHSRKCLSIIPYLPHFVNPFFREPGGRHFPRSDSHSRGRAATGSGFCSPPGTGAPGWRR